MASIKSVLGFTLHENMSVADMTGIWNEKATQEVKEANPDLDALFIQCTIEVGVLDGLRDAQVTAVEIYEAAQLAVENASALLVGNLQQPIALAASLAASAAQELQLLSVTGKKAQIVAELDEIEES